MSQSLTIITITMAAYLIMTIGIGFMYSKRSNSVNSFYLGDRKLGPIVTAMSAEASDMSSYLLMGLPGLAYFCGIADVTWTIIGLAAGTYLNWLFVAKRLRRYSYVAGNAITVPDFFKNRLHDKGKVLVGAAALIIIIFFIPYTASGFAACGKLFSTLLPGVSYMPAMLVSAAIIVLYTTLGGFLAVSVTDLIQSIVMTIALVAVVIFGVIMVGGINTIIETANQVPGYLSMNETTDVVNQVSSPYGFLTVISTLAWGLGYFGMPHILLRFMATKDEGNIKTSRRIATIWVVISMAVAVFIGIMGFVMSQKGLIAAFSTNTDAEKIIVAIADYLSGYGILPALLAGLVLAGILASTMSTADSQLLAAASSISENILGSVFGVTLSKKKTLLVARLTVIVISIIAVFLAQNPDSSVFGIVSFAWAGFGAAFGPLMIMSLFWRRLNKPGAIAGVISGGAMVFIWKFLVRPLGGAWNIYELLPAFVVAFIAIVIVSLSTTAPSKEVTADFDKVAAMK